MLLANQGQFKTVLPAPPFVIVNMILFFFFFQMNLIINDRPSSRGIISLVAIVLLNQISIHSVVKGKKTLILFLYFVWTVNFVRMETHLDWFTLKRWWVSTSKMGKPTTYEIRVVVFPIFRWKPTAVGFPGGFPPGQH